MMTLTELTIGDTVRHERERRGWPVSELAGRADVSRAMIARVERGAANPTAALLGRLSGAFGLPLSQLIARAEDGAPRRHTTPADQPVWTDPETGYVRRSLSAPSGSAIELVEIVLPPGAAVAYPASAYAFLEQQVWMLEGTLVLGEGREETTLGSGDCLALGAPVARTFANRTRRPCRYLVVIARR